ncbi:hypothetical protein B0A55_09743 [Friedmanniomyces simplex]|uniref:Kinetochore protein mis14 n=1 Tax=Friedmanniomyces simplex TaxID=329884 RepID=A0A4U0WRG9_9PEZI|nr:hypothetical protein B0A55_09743 [Friedmanniomyces simplex]
MNIFESNVPQEGNRATETAHRKIELQAPADLTYLIANLSRAAREKLDKHLPPDAVPEDEDAMRKRVEELVDDYIRNTFTAAKDSMSINGMDAKEMEAEVAKAQEGEEIEPFDTKLAQRLQALSSQIEFQTLQLANLRRTAPAETARRFRERYAKDTQEYDTRLREVEERELQAARETKVDPGHVERVDEMQSTWQRGSDELLALKSGLGSTVARLEKAQKAVDVVGEK